MKALLIYYSVSGNTAKITKLIKEFLNENGVQTTSMNIIGAKLPDVSSFDIIGIGFPIYEFRPPLLLKETVDKLNLKGKRVFIYASYGSVWTGDAIDRLIKLLRKKGAIIIGAITIPMSHTYNFLFRKKIERKLHEEDFELLRYFVREILNSECEIKHFHPFHTRILSTLLTPLTSPKLMPKIKIDHEKCSKCDVCIRICPTQTIKKSKDGFPKIDYSRCMKCYLCIKTCPYGALYTNNKFIERMVHSVKYLFRDQGRISIKTAKCL